MPEISRYIKQLLMILTVFLFSVFNPLSGQNKVGTTIFQFLKVMPDAQSTGMGDAVTSTINNANAVFYNPAGLSEVKKRDLSLSFYEYFFDVKTTALSLAYNIGTGGTLGLHAIFTDVGSIDVTTTEQLVFMEDGTYNPGLTGETISPNQMVAGLSLAKSLTDKFSFGVSSKYVREDLVMASADGFVFDFGLVYKTGYRSIQTSAVIRNFGPEISFSDDEITTNNSDFESYPPPQTLVIGVSGFIISSASPMFFRSEEQSLRVAFEIVGPRDYGQQYNTGLEWGYQDLLFIRTGYKFNYDTQGINFGMGVRINNFRGDYSYASYGKYLLNIHRISAGIEF
ncbi:MAG: PorV/PorQ family protein [Candidatus Marinimicrobia bacterium]|nr:PorV/PorQ family protein [Candidatus Neomarinimicrobiota bacterium]